MCCGAVIAGLAECQSQYNNRLYSDFSVWQRRMRRLGGILLISLAAVIASDSSAQPKKPSGPNPPSAQVAKSSTTDQRGTDQMPLSIKVIPQDISRDEKAGRLEKAAIDQKVAFETQRVADYTWWLAFLTLFLAFIAFGQAGLFVWQLRYMRGGMEDAAKAANAADLSARAAIALELPIIRMNAGGLGYGINQDGKGSQQHVCSVDRIFLSNLGKTKAFPIEVQFGWTVGDRLPDDPVYPFVKTFPTNDILDPAKEAVEVSLRQFEYETIPDLYDRLRALDISLWFYCKLVYLDFMDTRREVGFCWKQFETIGMGILRPDAAPTYNRKT
jgi:hypothetical protein